MAKKSKTNSSLVEKEYYEDIKTIDPTTNKEVIKKVKITRYKYKIVESTIDDDKDEMIEDINNKVSILKPTKNEDI